MRNRGNYPWYMHAGFNALQRAGRFAYDMYRGRAITPGILRQHAKQSSFSQKDMPPTRNVRMRSRSPGRQRGSRTRTPSPSSRSPFSPADSLRRTPKLRRVFAIKRQSVKRTRAVAVGSYKGKLGTKNKLVSPLPVIMKKGVQVCLESGHVVSTSSCMYIGHASCPTRVAKRSLWRALTKMILMRANKLNVDWNDVPVECNVGDTFVVEYRVTMDPAAALASSVVTYAAGLTQDQIALQFHANFEAFSSQFTINKMSYRPNNAGVGNVVVFLNNAEIELDVFSQFKVQNQTVTLSADNEADDVNNVPLIGKSYEGRGTGTKYQVERFASIPFICDPAYGVIEKAGTTNDLAEPPSAKMFQQVTKSGKASLAPGEIKTSTIRYQKRLGLQNFITLIYDLQTDFAPKYKLKHLGEFKFYAFEKQIDSLVAAPENNIRIAYEHDLKFAAMIIPHAFTATTQLYDQYIGAP